MSTLRIRIPESGLGADGGDLLPWAQIGKDGALQRSGRALLADIAKSDHIELVVPAGVVLLTNIKLPPVRGAKLRQMLPFAVEEQILQDPEDVHVAAGPRQPDGSTPVAVIEKAWLRGVLDALKQAGFVPQRVLIETLLPNFEPGSWTLAWNGAESFVRTGSFSGFALNAADEAIPPLELAQSLKVARAQQNAPQPIVVRPVAGGADTALPNTDMWADALGTSVVLEREWDFASSAAPAGGSIDLLQGDFAQTLGVKDLLPRLKPALVLAGLIALLQFGITSFEWWRLSREKQQLENQMVQTVRGVFPDAKVDKDIVETVLQTRVNYLRGASGEMTTGDFLPLLQQLAPLVRGTPGTKIKNLSYQDGELRADLVLPNEASADALKAQAPQAPVQLKVEAVNRSAAGSEARIVLRVKPRSTS
jgi:general secretion pathway protein L